MMKEGDLLEQHLAASSPREKDFINQAIQHGYILPFAPGQWIYSGHWVQILRQLQTLFVSQMCQHLSFEEWIFPRLIPKEALNTFKLTHYKPGMLFGVGSYEGEKGYFGVLDPVQCVSLYYLLQQSPQQLDNLPLKIVECLGGWTWRNEKPEELHGPIRAREFLRIENVFVGLPDQVQQLRADVEQEILTFLSDLDLSWRVVVGVGCMDIPSLKERTETAQERDTVPVHDIEIFIGDKNTTGEGPWLEISGCTVEGDHQINSFGISHPSNKPLWSGCCGLGMNRLLSCLFLQHGFNFSEWPEKIRAFLALTE